MSEQGFKQATQGNVVKFEVKGDHLWGTYLGVSESKQYPGSYALKVKDLRDGETKVVFVNNIVTDLIETNQIRIGDEIKLMFKGMKESEAGRKYKDYELYFKQ